MSQEEFTSPPTSPGYNGTKVWLVIGTILTIGIVLVVMAIMQDPLPAKSNNGAVDDKNQQKDKPTAVKSTDDQIDQIITSTSVRKPVDQAQESEFVPPVITHGQIPINQINTQVAPGQDEFEKSVINARNQEKIKRLNQKYEAFRSKSLISLNGIGGKSNSSGVATQTYSGNPRIESGAANNSNSDKLYSSSKIIKPKSKFELKAGSVIPCIGITEINSEISGNVICMVTDNVYDTATGQYILIPQGAKLFGKYDGNVAYGSNRLASAWTQLNYPNGDSIDLQGIPGTDLSGANGLSDQVDNHYWSMIGTSAVMGVITASMQYSQNNTNANVQSGGGGLGYTNPNPTVGQTLSGSLGQQLGQTGMAITNKQLNVAPTITIRKGMPYYVMPVQTIVLDDYSNM